MLFVFSFFSLERLHLGQRDGVCFVFFFFLKKKKQISAVFIEICIILPGNAAPF